MTDGKPQREQPWSIRGVSHEARAAAGIAAKQAGETLGVWLDRTIRDAAADQLSSKGKQEVGPTQAEIMAQVAEMVAGVNKRLDQMEQQQATKDVAPQKTGIFAGLFGSTTRKPGAR